MTKTPNHDKLKLMVKLMDGSITDLQTFFQNNAKSKKHLKIRVRLDDIATDFLTDASIYLAQIQQVEKAIADAPDERRRLYFKTVMVGLILSLMWTMKKTTTRLTKARTVNQMLAATNP